MQIAHKPRYEAARRARLDAPAARLYHWHMRGSQRSACAKALRHMSRRTVMGLFRTAWAS